MDGRARKMYEDKTYQPTQYHRDLFSGKIQATNHDILELWSVAQESVHWTGKRPVTLQDFAEWILAGGEVTW